MRNRYRGTCHVCISGVAAGEGFYADGKIFCSEPIWFVPPAESAQTVWCLAHFNQQRGTACASADEAHDAVANDAKAAQEAAREKVRVALVNGGIAEEAAQARVRSLNAVIEKMFGKVMPLEEMSWDQITDLRNELTRRVAARESRGVLKTFKDDGICPRCGGLGGSEKWRETGWTCHRCLGSGKF